MRNPSWVIDATLRAKGFQFSAPPSTYRGPVSVHGNMAIVEIAIPDLTFAVPPAVRLLDRSNMPHVPLAHILNDNQICYIGEGGLPLNMYDPGGSVLRVLIEVEEALKKSFGSNAANEFDAELASYWQGKRVFFALRQPSTNCVTHADIIAKPGASEGLIVVGKGQWPHGTHRQPVCVINFCRPLCHGANFPPATLQGALDYIAAQPAPPKDWQQSVMTAAANLEAMFLSAPNAKIGWLPILPNKLKVASKAKGFRPSFLRAAIDKAPREIGLERMTGVETDLEFCVNRNLLGQTTLIERNISLIGCGTIGGYLARLLVQSGAGCGSKLVLYDNDVMGPGNLGRHVLGFNDLEKSKARAMADHLRAFHPDVLVEHRNCNALEDRENLSKADLIIDATGDPNVSTAINELHHRGRLGRNCAVLYAWVFGNGVAAQTFLDRNDGRACYCCLKTGFDGEWRFNPLKDPTSPLRQAAARCGEAGYIPFSVDAPVAAAALAIRAILDWAAGVYDPRMRTTVLDTRAGRSKMTNTSPEPLKGCLACDPRD